MMRIQARKLLKYSTEELWDRLTGEFVLVFDDGEIETNWKQTLYSSYAWDYVRLNPGAPLLIQHHLKSVLKGKRISSSTHLGLIGEVCWTTYDFASQGLSEEAKLQLRYQFAEKAYRIMNHMYNELTYRLEEYVTSLDIVDFVNAFYHPGIQASYDKLQPTEAGIAQHYKEITAVMTEKGEIWANPLSKLFRSGLVKENQVHQCLGANGFRTDVNSYQFSTPVLRGYVEGLATFYASAVESRSAAKALVFSKEPLQDAEYFSRRLQLVGMSVERLHFEDCGSQRYLKWRVRPKEIANGEVVYGGDLQHLVGKYYKQPDGSLKVITRKDEHLIGQEIEMRSILGCMHRDPNGACMTCFGALSDSIPDHSNIGHMCTTFMTQQSSQSVLSVKHLDGSATLEAIVMTEEEKKILKAGPDKRSYYLVDALKGCSIKMKILLSMAPNLSDVSKKEDVTELTLTRISNVGQVWFEIDDGKSVYTAEVHTALDEKRLASLTYDMLQYVKDEGWELVVPESDNNRASGNEVICIDLSQWSWSKPLLVLPPKHFNYSDHSKMISEKLESSVKESQKRNIINPRQLLIELFEHVNSKLSVNLAILEIIFHSAQVVDINQDDYSLPKPWTSQGVGVMRATMDMRSMAPRMAYERHQEVILNPASYTRTNRVESPFDAIIMPREVIAARPVMTYGARWR